MKTHAIGRVRWFGLALSAALVLQASESRAASPYAAWSNGPPQTPNFFALAVWWQEANVTGHSGSYPSVAAAAAAMKINIFLGQGANWPERFGADTGELEAMQKYGLYLIGGVYTPYDTNTSAQSVASVLALASSIGALRNVIGYNAGDEPACGGSVVQGPGASMADVPMVVAGIQAYDPTRLVAYNFADWMLQPQYQSASCMKANLAALGAVGFGSFDFYPATNAWTHKPGSNFLSTPEDTLYMQGLSTAAIVHYARPNQPIWVYVESGGDNLGFSGQNNNFPGGVSSGSTTLVNDGGWSRFTATWIGLTVSGAGIPPGTKISEIVDATHAAMSAAATADGSREAITVTGGDGSDTDCVARVNLCVVNGNEYRATPAQVSAEVWMSIINGANGIEYFCHDSFSDFFCMGDAAGGAAATRTQENLQYINTIVLRYARILNSKTVGICSMQLMDYTTGAESTKKSCSNGILTMTTNNAAVPGMALAKLSAGNTFLFAQSDRRSVGGAAFTYVLAGLAGKTATVIYDSNERYDRQNSTIGAVFALDSSGQFSDVLGANNDEYQVKIYRIQ